MADDEMKKNAIEEYKKHVALNLAAGDFVSRFRLMFTRYPEGIVISCIESGEIIAIFRIENDNWGKTITLTPYESCSVSGTSLEDLPHH